MRVIGRRKSLRTWAIGLVLVVAAGGIVAGIGIVGDNPVKVQEPIVFAFGQAELELDPDLSRLIDEHLTPAIESFADEVHLFIDAQETGETDGEAVYAQLQAMVDDINELFFDSNLESKFTQGELNDLLAPLTDEIANIRVAAEKTADVLLRELELKGLGDGDAKDALDAGRVLFDAGVAAGDASEAIDIFRAAWAKGVAVLALLGIDTGAADGNREGALT